MGIDKGLVQFRKQPMITRSLKTASKVCNEVLIIANKQGYEKFGYPVYTDIHMNKGPLGGIHSGLSHSCTDHNLVLACDLPMLTVDFLEYLIDHCSDNDLMVVPRHAGQLEPLCAIYHRDCLPLIENALASGDLSIHGFLKYNRTKFIDIDNNLPCYSPYLFQNVNTVDDLKEAEQKKDES